MLCKFFFNVFERKLIRKEFSYKQLNISGIYRACKNIHQKIISFDRKPFYFAVS